MENNKLFVYGILKKGYELDLATYGVWFIGEARIEGATLYGIHPTGQGEYSGVGLRLDGLNTAYGELWEIPEYLWDWLDMIEQNNRCYTRKMVEVQVMDKDGAGVTSVNAWVYEHTYPGFKYEYPIKGGKF